MTNIVVWAILACAVLGAGSTLALSSANAQLTAAVRTEMRRQGLYGKGVGCLVASIGLALLALWTWYAFAIRDWRFAAIVWIPYLANLISKMVVKKAAVE